MFCVLAEVDCIWENCENCVGITKHLCGSATGECVIPSIMLNEENYMCIPVLEKSVECDFQLIWCSKVDVESTGSRNRNMIEQRETLTDDHACRLCFK